MGVAEALNNLALTASLRGERDQEIALHEQSLRIRRELGDKRGIAMSLFKLGEGLLDEDLERAEVMIEEGLRLARELGDKTFVAGALDGQGRVALERGDLERAAALLGESLWMCREMGSILGIFIGRASLASVAAATGPPERAARLWGAAEGLCEATGVNLDSPLVSRFYERYRAAARAELDEVAWQEALTDGRAMTLEEAISYALKDVEEHT